ncbi:MAG: hypothetical protein ACRD29_09890 [Acidimicrobiales bacterium]
MPRCRSSRWPFGRYTDVCLGWYLGPGRIWARVLDDGDRVAGYVLVCPDEERHRRWVRPRAVSFAVVAVVAASVRHPCDPASMLVRLRIRDGWARRHAPSPMSVHAHMNLDRSVRGTRAALMLVDHVDDVCRSLGAVGWYGEVNARVGRRATALERLVGPVVDRTPNRTASWLVGKPVERLTVVRPVAVVSPPSAAAEAVA